MQSGTTPGTRMPATMSAERSLDVRELDLSQSPDPLDNAWDKLAGMSQAAGPFLDSRWLQVCRANGGAGELRAAVAYEVDRPAGAGVLRERQQRALGFPIRVGESPTFDWLSRYEFLAEPGRPEICKALWRFWLSEGRFDEIRLELLDVDSETHRTGLQVAEDLGWTARSEETCRSPWLRLPESAAVLEDGLKSKFKANLRNRERRLAGQGQVTFEVIRDHGRLPEAMETFYALEAAGWKGEANTSIAQRADIRGFYDALVARVPGQIWVPVLRLNDRPIAAQLIRAFGNTVFLLKIGFDPDFSPYSPGQLITSRTLGYAIAEGMQRFDFLGEQMTWKMDWNPELRTFHRLVLCAPTWAGRRAWWTRYGYREALKRVPGLARLRGLLKGSGVRDA